MYSVIVWYCLLVGCLTSQQQASVSQGQICSDNCTCCHTEIEVADQTFCLTQSQYTDTGPISPSADPRTPGAWQGSHWSANFEVTGMTRPRKNPGASGIRTRDLPLSRRTPYHKANEAVYIYGMVDCVNVQLVLWAKNIFTKFTVQALQAPELCQCSQASLDSAKSGAG